MNLSDHQQFELAYRRLAPVGLRVANSVLSDRAAAEDVVQDLFFQLWRNPHVYDPRRGSLRSYVALLARSRSIDRRRSMSARKSALEQLASATGGRQEGIANGADETADRRERSRRMLSTLDKLPAGQREALLLTYGRGLTAEEIARAADLPVGTAKSRIRLGLARAREHLRESA